MKNRVSLCREIIIIHLNANALGVHAHAAQALGKVLHRVPLGGLHVVVGVTHNPVVGHPDGPHPAIGILISTPPNRVRIRQHDHTLMDVKRPAVIAGQPVLIRRVRDKQNIHAIGLHSLARLVQPAIKLTL